MRDKLKNIKTENIKEINKQFSSGTLLRQGLNAIYTSYMYSHACSLGPEVVTYKCIHVQFQKFDSHACSLS